VQRQILSKLRERNIAMEKQVSPQVKGPLPNDLEENEWTFRRRRTFARNLLHKRRTYDEYFSKGLAKVDVALRRVQCNRGYAIERVHAQHGPCYEPWLERPPHYRLRLEGSVKLRECGRKEKEMLKKYAASVKSKKLEKCERLQVLEKKRVERARLAKLAAEEERERKAKLSVDELIARGRAARLARGIPDRPDGDEPINRRSRYPGLGSSDAPRFAPNYGRF
jgi:hypothetical protein